MSLLGVTPPLRLLLRLKLRGAVRLHWRRMRTPRGFLLTVAGAAMLALWIGSLAMGLKGGAGALDVRSAELRVRFFALIMLVLSVSGALTNRGLYLPRREIERLFSAPLTRAQLVRYRLVAGGLRSLIGGAMLGLFGALRMPSPALAFAGILLAMQTLPVLNQLVAIALAGLERRAARVLRSVATAALVLVLGTLGVVAFVLATDRPVASLPGLGPWLEGLVLQGGDPLADPVLDRATLLFLPWGRMVAAGGVPEFAAWFAVCLLLHVALIELCARLPVDFRELSLRTSARAAARQANLRRGGGAAGVRASAASARWRVPRLFGRGPGGAIAWRKCIGMVRKAKGAFWVALVALLFITVFASFLEGPGGRGSAAPFWIAGLGTIYLCSGLRFDFREELERMDVVRTWPISPQRVFTAMLLPEVVLVSWLVAMTVLGDALLSRVAPAHVLGVVCCLPALVFVWAAVDNIVFLYWPVRSVPGQDGFVQNAGRRMLQMLALLVLGGIPVSIAVATWILTWRLAGGPGLAATALAYAAVLVVLAFACTALAILGGAVLRRFDVARDRG